MADGKATNCVTKRQHQLRGIDAQRGAVAGSHGDDGVDAVDVEEKRDHEDQQHAVVRDAAARVQKPGEGLGDVVQDALRPVLSSLP